MMKKANWKMIAAAAMIASLYIQTPAMAEETADMIIADETAVETEAAEIQTEAAEETSVFEIIGISETTEIPKEVADAAALSGQNSNGTKADETAETDSDETEADETAETGSDKTEADETAATGSDKANTDDTEEPETSAAEETEAAGTTEQEFTGDDEAADTESDEAGQPGTEEETEIPAAETEAEVTETEEFCSGAFHFNSEEAAITVVISEAAHLPKNAEVEVRKLAEGSAEYEAAKAAAVSCCGTDENASYSFYSVSILVDGSEVEVADGTVSIQIELADATQRVLRIDRSGARDVTAQTAAGGSLSSIEMAM